MSTTAGSIRRNPGTRGSDACVYLPSSTCGRSSLMCRNRPSWAPEPRVCSKANPRDRIEEDCGHIPTRSALVLEAPPLTACRQKYEV